MEYQKGRKRGDHIHCINRDNSKIKKQKVFNENQAKMISENIRIRPLINNFSNQKIKDRKYPKPINIKCPLFKKNNFILSEEAIEKCNKHQISNQKLQIYKSPNYLIIQIKND